MRGIDEVRRKVCTDLFARSRGIVVRSPRLTSVVVVSCLFVTWITWPSKIELFACPTSPTFAELCKASRTDKCQGNTHNVEGHLHAGHSYGLFYDQFVQQMRCKKDLRFLEIGMGYGHSLTMWRKYFSTPGALNFLDIRDLTRYQVRGTKVWVGDETDPVIANRIMKSAGGGFDIVVDDGSHIPDHIKATFMIYWPMLKPGGLYAIEDLNVGYGEPGTNGYRQQDMIKQFVDSLNRYNFDTNYTAGVNHLDHDIASLACGEEICLLVKKGGAATPSRGLPAWVWVNGIGISVLVYNYVASEAGIVSDMFSPVPGRAVGRDAFELDQL